jgi:hypothetical protein
MFCRISSMPQHTAMRCCCCCTHRQLAGSCGRACNSLPAFLTPRSDLERFLRSLICLRDLFTVSASPFCRSKGKQRMA